MRKPLAAFVIICILALPVPALARRHGHGPGPFHPNWGPGPVRPWGPPRHHRHWRHWHPRHHDGDVAAAAFLGALGGLALGSIVASRPEGYRTVVINGNEYYLHNGVYYQRCPSGYVVVNPPARETPPANPPVVINVPNANGSYTPVRLTPTGTGYTGPRGEFYQNLPTITQLKPIYGLKAE